MPTKIPGRAPYIDVHTDAEPEILGTREATEEEQELLNSVMDTIEQVIHGEYRDNIVETIDSTPELWQSTSQLASMIVSRVSHKLDEQQIEHDHSVFFGQNGAIQETVELLWEVADAMGHPAAEDPDQFHGAYLATLEVLGEMMFDDEESAKEAQDFMLEQEFGVDLIDLSAEELENEAIENSPSLPTEGGAIRSGSGSGISEQLLRGRQF